MAGVTYRSQAWSIYAGHGGWTGRHLGLRELEELDFIFFKFPKGLPRPMGINHLGIAFGNPVTGEIELLHASGSVGHVQIEPLMGRYLQHFFEGKRLTVGD